jgi:hypothetical protein
MRVLYAGRLPTCGISAPNLMRKHPYPPDVIGSSEYAIAASETCLACRQVQWVSVLELIKEDGYTSPRTAFCSVKLGWGA